MIYIKVIQNDSEAIIQNYPVVYYSQESDEVTILSGVKPNTPLKFTANGDSTLGLINNASNAPILYKSTDGKTWETWDYSTINITDGQSVYIKGDNPNGFSTDSFKFSQFTMTGSIACEGNVMSLLGENVTDIPCEYCYFNMFNSCSSLTTAPELPATTLTEGCYESMFHWCSSLTTAPELPATTLAEGCYVEMFFNCERLTSAPELPATTLTNDCYAGMFEGCGSLTTAPKLPATTLASNCYGSMFATCTSLTTAPELPATTLAEECYAGMFEGCSNLNYIKVGATSWNTADACDWVIGVSSTGAFVKPSATTIENGTSGIPNGWLVQNR